MKSAACSPVLQGALSLPCIKLESLQFWGASSVYQGTLRIIPNWWRCLIKPLCTFKFKITVYLTFAIVNSGCSDGLVHLPWAEGRGNVIWGLNSQARCWRSSLESAGLSPPSLTPLLYTCHWPRSPSVLDHPLSFGPSTPSFSVQILIWSNLISFSFPSLPNLSIFSLWKNVWAYPLTSEKS